MAREPFGAGPLEDARIVARDPLALAGAGPPARVSVSFSMPMNSSSASEVRISSSSLAWIAAPSRFWLFWIRNTIRKVTMVVEVLITSCQVWE